MDLSDIALVLLAAGQSRRFGTNKLAASLHGVRVARHVADRLAALPFARHFVVTRPETPLLPGYACLPLIPADAPQGRSLAVGVAAARQAGARAVMVALADMPLVPDSHVRALLAAFAGDRIASRSATGTPMPPALFGAQHFAALESLDGDRGAGALLRDAPFVTLPPGTERDIDTPADLAEAERWLSDET